MPSSRSVAVSILVASSTTESGPRSHQLRGQSPPSAPYTQPYQGTRNSIPPRRSFVLMSDPSDLAHAYSLTYPTRSKSNLDLHSSSHQSHLPFQRAWSAEKVPHHLINEHRWSLSAFQMISWHRRQEKSPRQLKIPNVYQCPLLTVRRKPHLRGD